MKLTKKKTQSLPVCSLYSKLWNVRNDSGEFEEMNLVSSLKKRSYKEGPELSETERENITWYTYWKKIPRSP